MEARLFRSKDGILCQFGVIEIDVVDHADAPRDIVHEGERFRRFNECGFPLPLSYLDYEDSIRSVAETLLKMVESE